jgi:hypothetical protein
MNWKNGKEKNSSHIKVNHQKRFQLSTFNLKKGIV